MAENQDVEMWEANRQRDCWRALSDGGVVSNIWTHKALCWFWLGKQAR